MDCGTRKEAALVLKTAKGQIEGVLKMLDDDRYCIDVSKQILAVQSHLKKANLLVLRGHIKSCVADALEKGEGAEKIEEIFEIIDRYARPA